MKHHLLKVLITFLLSLNAYADLARIIDDPKVAIDLRHELIESAKEEILISYFIFAKDETAIEVLAALRQKVREGVKVKILVDDLFNDIPPFVSTQLQNEGMEIKNFNVFNPMRPLLSIKYRLHDKLFIVDQEKLIIGGRNIENTYYGRDLKNYQDRDIYVEGSMAKKASEYFLELWPMEHVKASKEKKINNKRKERKLLAADQMLNNGLSAHQRRGVDFDFNTWKKESINIESVELLHDDISPRKNGTTGTTKGLYDLLKSAKHTILIDSPYLILTRELEAILKGALERGVRIRILTNSLKATDGILPQAGYISQRKKIVRMGVELYEFFGDDSLHSKSMVIDDEISIIGSFNLDPRSQNLNTEIMGVFHNKELSTLLTKSMDEGLRVSSRIDRNGKPEGYRTGLPEVSKKKIVLTRIIQFVLVPFIKGLL